jgi:hypothetical protein
MAQQYTYDGKNWRDGSGGVVTGPLAIELNDRAKAQMAGIDYNKVSKVTQFRNNRDQGKSGFAFGPDTTGVFSGFVQGLLGDPALSASQGIHHILSEVGIESPNQAQYYDEVARERGQQISNAPTSAQIARLLGDFALPLPFGKAKAVTTVGRLAEGAKIGAVSGAVMPTEGQGDDYFTQKGSQATLGALFGAPLNAALGKVADIGLSSHAPSAADLRMQAGERQGMPLGYSQVTDSGPVRMFSNISSRLPGGRALRTQSQNTVNKFDERIGDATAATGRTLERADLGQHLDQALGNKGGFTSRFQDTADDNFNRITRTVHPTTQVDLASTVKAMNDVADSFPSNPRLGAQLTNPALKSLRDAMTDDSGNAIPLFFNEAQTLRSKIGRMMGDPVLVNDIPRRELAKVYGAISEDMRNALTSQPVALKAFDRATREYKAGMNRIHSYIEPITTLGSNERMADKVIGMVKNDAKGIAAIRRSVTPEQWDTVAASIFHGLGHATAGERDATNAGFSIPRFLTDFNKLRENKKAFDFAFGGTRYANLRNTYHDLAQVADSVKQSVKQSNPSYSGYTGGGLALGAALLTNLPTAIKAIAGNYAFAHLMAHPIFARWLVKLGRIIRQGNVKNGKAAEIALRLHVGKIPAMAAAHSELADGLDSVYSYFLNGGAQPQTDEAK